MTYTVIWIVKVHRKLQPTSVYSEWNVIFTDKLINTIKMINIVESAIQINVNWIGELRLPRSKAVEMLCVCVCVCVWRTQTQRSGVVPASDGSRHACYIRTSLQTVEMKKDIDFSKKLSPIPQKDESLVGNESFNVPRKYESLDAVNESQALLEINFLLWTNTFNKV